MMILMPFYSICWLSSFQAACCLLLLMLISILMLMLLLLLLSLLLLLLWVLIFVFHFSVTLAARIKRYYVILGVECNANKNHLKISLSSSTKWNFFFLSAQYVCALVDGFRICSLQFTSYSISFCGFVFSFSCRFLFLGMLLLLIVFLVWECLLYFTYSFLLFFLTPAQCSQLMHILYAFLSHQEGLCFAINFA